MSFNIVGETIEQYLDQVAGNHSEKGVAELLRYALLRPLRKELSRQERPDNLERMTALPKGAPGWLRQSFNQDMAVYGFAPRAEMREAIAHIADWLAAALVNDEAWLRDLDEQGRPKKLVKLGSLERVTKEVDKAMLLAAQKGAANLYADEQGHEQTEMVFDGGYRMVRLLTPEALDKESAMMGHCIGSGGYDARVKGGTRAYYSLRDPRGKSHATLEVKCGWEELACGRRDALLQCQGKGNWPPVAKYVPFIQSFVKERKLRLGNQAARTADLIEQDGEYYDVFNLPDDFTVEGGLYLNGSAIRALPRGLTVKGDLELWRTPIKTLPEGLRVEGNLCLGGTAIKELPEGLRVGGSLFLDDTAITALPEGLRVGGGLYLDGTAIKELPAGLKVEGSLSLRRTPIRALPEGLTVSGNLDVSQTALVELPKGLKVEGNLYLDGTAIKEVPEGVGIGMRFDDLQARKKRLPEELAVGRPLVPEGTAAEGNGGGADPAVRWPCKVPFLFS